LQAVEAEDLCSKDLGEMAWIGFIVQLTGLEHCREYYKGEALNYTVLEFKRDSYLEGPSEFHEGFISLKPEDTLRLLESETIAASRLSSKHAGKLIPYPEGWEVLELVKEYGSSGYDSGKVINGDETGQRALKGQITVLENPFIEREDKNDEE